MLLPLLIGVAAGVALGKYVLADGEEECKDKKKKKDKGGEMDDGQENDWTGSVKDYIRKAKQSHPAAVPRRATAKKLLMKLEGTEKEGTISRETFDRAKAVVEEYCGIRALEYDEKNKTVCGGEIDEECPEKPVLDAHKLEYLTKEELILIAPKLKDLFADEG